MDGFKCYFEECFCSGAITSEQVSGESRQVEKLGIDGLGASRRVAL